MAENKTLTKEEKQAVITDLLEWGTTAFYNALVYVGSKKMAVAGTVTGPDGKKYFISFKPTENGTISSEHQNETGEKGVQAIAVASTD